MRLIWKILIVAAVVFGLLAAFLIIPHYRVKAAVNAYRAQLIARGEKMTVAELTPSLPGAVSNGASGFTSASAMAGYFTNSPPIMAWVAPGHAVVGWKEAALPNDDMTNCWPEFLEAVQNQQENIAAIRAALQKPVLAFPVNYQLGYGTLLPHLARVKSASMDLSYATSAALHEGDAAAAWKNLLAESRLVRLNTSEPLEISQLVRLATVQVAIPITWEALQAPGWTADQLAQLQTNWDSFDLLPQSVPALSMERLMSESAIAEMRLSYSNYASLSSSPFMSGTTSSYTTLSQIVDDPIDGLAAHMRYTAWKNWGSYEENLFDLQVFQAAIETIRRVQTNNSFASEFVRLKQAFTNLSQAHPGYQKRFAFAEVAEWVESYLPRIMNGELSRRTLVTAIALQRFQLEHGKYPAQLAELVPAYLPQVPIDIMDGKPLRYRLKEDGSFLLYSVGQDSRDDGGDGSPLPDDNSKHKQWYNMRDAVWPSPATPDEVKKYKADALVKLSQKRGPGKLVPRLTVPPPPATNSGTN